MELLVQSLQRIEERWDVAIWAGYWELLIASQPDGILENKPNDIPILKWRKEILEVSQALSTHFGWRNDYWKATERDGNGQRFL